MTFRFQFRNNLLLIPTQSLLYFPRNAILEIKRNPCHSYGVQAKRTSHPTLKSHVWKLLEEQMNIYSIHLPSSTGIIHYKHEPNRCKKEAIKVMSLESEHPGQFLVLSFKYDIKPLSTHSNVLYGYMRL